MNNPSKNIACDTGARTEKAQDGKDMIRMESRKKTDRRSKDGDRWRYIKKGPVGIEIKYVRYVKNCAQRMDSVGGGCRKLSMGKEVKDRGLVWQRSRFFLKVLSSHSKWGVRLGSFDPMLKSRCPASF
jgi:hypothetical protein